MDEVELGAGSAPAPLPYAALCWRAPCYGCRIIALFSHRTHRSED